MAGPSDGPLMPVVRTKEEGRPQEEVLEVLPVSSRLAAGFSSTDSIEAVGSVANGDINKRCTLGTQVRVAWRLQRLRRFVTVSPELGQKAHESGVIHGVDQMAVEPERRIDLSWVSREGGRRNVVFAAAT